MAENSMKPRIRFKGYTDAWEQRKLEDCIDLGCGRDYKHLSEGTIPVYGTGGYMLSVNKALSYERDGIGIGRKGTIDKPYLLKAPFWTVDTLFFAIPKEKTAIFFLLCLFNKIDWKSKDESTGVPSLSKQTINAVDVKTPKISEQQQIGQLFAKIDNLITLHQRKYDKFVNIKKALLEKMFPQGEETTPKIRFKGFTDAWEQRKLGQISIKVVDKNKERLYGETFTNSAEFGVISQRDFFDHDIAKNESLDGYYVVREDDFVYNPRISTTAPVGPINRNKLGKKGVMSPLYTVFTPKEIDFGYLEWFFKSSVWHRFMQLNGDSGARSDRFSIKDKLFFEMPIPYPSIDEQNKIGVFLQYLDNLITLHQRQLEKLKNIKSALLEKMFV